MHDVNTYLLYKRLHEFHTPYCAVLNMKVSMSKLTHALCQRGEPMRKQQAEYIHHMWLMHMLDFLPWEWDKRYHVLNTNIWMYSNQRPQLLDLMCRNCTIQTRSTLGDTIREFLTGRKEGVCERDALIWLWVRENTSVDTTRLYVVRSAV